jgi:LCP family protein required for cell wall assembly
MSNFKRHNPSKKPVSSIDGFIPSSSTQGDIRRRFRQNYRPQASFGIDSAKPNLATTKKLPKSDGFVPLEKNSSFATQDIEGKSAAFVGSAFDLETTPAKEAHKRRRLFGRKSKSDKSRMHNKHRGRKALRVAGTLTIVMMLGIASILGYAFLKQRQIFNGNGEGAAALDKNVDPSRLNGEGDGRVNILLLGKGGPGHEAPDLTDTILLASVDPVQKEVALLSVPRDLFVEDPVGSENKINAVYSNSKQRKAAQGGDSDADKQAAEDAGLKAIKQTVSEVLGVPVHYYVMVDFEAFREAIDTVGGINVDVKEPLYDATMAWMNGGRALIADEGLQTFDGQKALMYARSRYGSARGDFDRTERQREVILALQQKVLTVGTFSNPIKIVELMNTLGENVRTDLNGVGELRRLYEIMQEVSPDKFISVGLADPPNVLVSTDFVANQSVVVPVAGLYQYEDIQSYVRNNLRDAFLRQENARIVILNGTSTPGLASFREKELKSYGYNIVAVDNAPTDDYVESKLIDLSGNTKPFTASYLEKRLKLTKSSEVIPGLPTNETADFVILLGSNEATETTTN